VIGAAHSGWRGTVAGVLPRTIEAMAALGGAPERLHAWIAPCISTEAFEVGEEVAEHFAPTLVARRPEWPRPHVDLRAALRAQLDAAGVPAANVEVDDRCPALDTATFYSYRAEGGTPGRMIGYIGRRSAS
jgi:copper oxidase (laccase) domain-containing protein